jgi:hypothetical protein
MALRSTGAKDRMLEKQEAIVGKRCMDRGRWEAGKRTRDSSKTEEGRRCWREDPSSIDSSNPSRC